MREPRDLAITVKEGSRLVAVEVYSCGHDDVVLDGNLTTPAAARKVAAWLERWAKWSEAQR